MVSSVETRRIKRPEDLEAMKSAEEKKRSEEAIKGLFEIRVCTGGGCIASGAMNVITALQEEIDANSLNVRLIPTGCLGPCIKGPVVLVSPGGVLYQNVQPDDAREIVREHLCNGTVVKRLVYHDNVTKKPEKNIEDITFFKKQTKIVLGNCGVINPEKIEEYIARDGYRGLANAVARMTADEVIEEVKKSGLRGRGGAGFPTWLKWNFTKKEQSDVKFVVCNGDEGDPGAFMDRSIIEGDPHALIEGMTICAYAIGAKQGYVYVRAEYPLAVQRLQRAMDQAKEYGLLGADIFGSGFSFDLEIRMGSGAFVCGEETALLTSIESNRGEPRPRPPFPAQKGLWDRPTVLNNVETYSNIPKILDKGGEFLAGYGTEKSKGTKVFALAGTIRNAGLVEVPIGTSLGELIYDIGGGIINGREYKAAQIGGPSGGCIPKQHLNVPLDYESLNELGAIMGSGGLVVMDENNCMVDVSRFFLDFVQDESCGKCSPCRVGTKRMLEILDRICSGCGAEGDVEKLISLGNVIKDTALCGLGQTAPNPVLSTIRYFRKEYEDHIRNHHCEAGLCADISRAPCQSGCPANVDIPGFVGLTKEKRYDEALVRHRERNPLAAICARICFHFCENRCRRTTMDDSVPIRAIKRYMVDHSEMSLLPEMRESSKNASRKIAIIGAGPAGLTCAYFLRRLGYRPEIFEAEKVAGGMLVKAIPAYRLPRDVVNDEIETILGADVPIHYGRRLGKDFTLEHLKTDGYEAVFLAIGAQGSTPAGIEGEESEGVVHALDFLEEYNLKGHPAVGENVIVIGGGNAAIDSARTALRLGAKSVRVVYRRSRGELPAYEEEVNEAEREGVALDVLTTPYKIVKKDGKVAGVLCHKMKLGSYDSSGRRRPEVVEGQDHEIPADQVIIAVGQRLRNEDLAASKEAKMNGSGFVEIIDDRGATAEPWVFAGGDAVSGPASAVEAIGAGERVAISIHEYLKGEGAAFWLQEKEGVYFDADAEPSMAPKEDPAMIELEKRRGDFEEVELCYDGAVAICQAARCLRCEYRPEAVDPQEVEI